MSIPQPGYLSTKKHSPAPECWGNYSAAIVFLNLFVMKGGAAAVEPDGLVTHLHRGKRDESGLLDKLLHVTLQKYGRQLHGWMENGKSFRQNPAKLYHYE